MAPLLPRAEVRASSLPTWPLPRRPAGPPPPLQSRFRELQALGARCPGRGGARGLTRPPLRPKLWGRCCGRLSAAAAPRGRRGGLSAAAWWPPGQHGVPGVAGAGSATPCRPRRGPGPRGGKAVHRRPLRDTKAQTGRSWPPGCGGLGQAGPGARAAGAREHVPSGVGVRLSAPGVRTRPDPRPRSPAQGPRPPGLVSLEPLAGRLPEGPARSEPPVPPALLALVVVRGPGRGLREGDGVEPPAPGLPRAREAAGGAQTPGPGQEGGQGPAPPAPMAPGDGGGRVGAPALCWPGSATATACARRGTSPTSWRPRVCRAPSGSAVQARPGGGRDRTLMD